MAVPATRLTHLAKVNARPSLLRPFDLRPPPWRLLLLPLPPPSVRPTKAPVQRSYHSYDRAPSAPAYNATEEAILSAAMRHVPEHGFTEKALALGAEEAGYLDLSSVNLFPQRAFELVNYHLVTERLRLKDRLQFEEIEEKLHTKLGVGARVRLLAIERLMANKDVVGRWQEALALMAHPTYVPPSLAELARLSDEIWFLAGDTSVDSSWYIKRASLAAIYSSAEVYMTQDSSTNFADTQQYLDRRLEDARAVGDTVSSVGEWLGFTGHAVVNVLRSKGVRI